MKWSVLFIAAMSCAAEAQIFNLRADLPPVAGVPGPRPVHGSVVRIDTAMLQATLAAVPDQRLDADLSTYGARLALPDPQGSMSECFVARSPVMEPELAAKFPAIMTYIVRSIDGAASGRFEMTPRGLTGMIRTPAGVWMVDPWQYGDPSHAVVYWLRDLPGGTDWSCETHVDPADAVPLGAGGYGPRAVQTLRTYRLAMACTGEYGLHQCTILNHAPNATDPLAAIVTVVARTNVVFEADLGIHFNLVANNDRVIYFDSDTDPYSSPCDGGGGSDCSSSYLGQNASTLSSRIGNANFDVGHLVTRVFGGVANLRSICTNSKARGISGIPRGGDTDPLSALVVIHELGHQFGANHTFSGSRGRCEGNVSLNTAWEAGSGSSPMAYAGGCPVGDAPPSDNIVQFADPFFHHGSLIEMRAFLAGNGSSCAAMSPSSNEIPIVTFVTPDQAVPPGTPFRLAAEASDANGDPLTFSWEQYDAGVSRPLSGDGAEDNGEGALFRVFPPVLDSGRTFPRMADVLSGVPTPGERLPTVTGVDRRFRVLVRDNFPGVGGTAISGLVTLSIAAGTSPFEIVSPGQNASLPPGSTVVEWTVGGTDVPPISCDSVAIWLSEDGGGTFAYDLGSFSNSGIAAVTLPDISTSHARLRIDPVGRAFFAVSRGFAVVGSCIADINRDGGVDGADVEAFFEIWTTGESGGDLNGDGGTDGSDVEFFFGVWEAGC